MLLVDQRYFGSSEGRATTLGFRERDDLKRMVDFLESRGATSVGVFGFSLGGAVAMLTAAEDPRIRAIVAYAPFADLRALGQEVYGWMWVARYPVRGGDAAVVAGGFRRATSRGPRRPRPPRG